MRKLWVIAAIVLLLTSVTASSAAAKPHTKNFVAVLSGTNEVPAVQSHAHGVAIFHLNRDGTELQYKLIVANITDVFMAHIHLGAAGANGPIVVWLYPSAPPPQPIPGRFSGVLAEGTITAADLMGPLAGASLQDLIDAMAAGSTYVNVHTEAHPGGEIRGQIRALGPGA